MINDEDFEKVRRTLIGKTIKDVEALNLSGDVIIRVVFSDNTDIIICCNDLGIWLGNDIDRKRYLENRSYKSRILKSTSNVEA